MGKQTSRLRRHAERSARRLCPIGAVLCTVLAFAPGARADAVVSLTAEGQLRASVQPRTGADGNHGIIVELYKDLTRNGFRARQDQGGRPAFSTSDGDCLHNVFVNDVVCSGPHASVDVNGGDGGDLVTAMEQPNGEVPADELPALFRVDVFGVEVPLLFPFIPLPIAGDPAGLTCAALPVDAENQPVSPQARTFQADLGAGDDFLLFVAQISCNEGFFPENHTSWRLDGNGGAGNDVMGEGLRNDVLDGGSGDDTLDGDEGDDVLRGGLDRDRMIGDVGDDTLDGGPGLDVLDGGPGFDTVTYADRTTRVNVRIGATGAGTDDTISPTVERVLGGSANDLMLGFSGFINQNGNLVPTGDSGGAQEFEGNGGPDALQGGGGPDRLEGGAGVDQLIGGPGIDKFSGGVDNDEVVARDGEPEDSIFCGAGTDFAHLDTQDELRPPTNPRVGRFDFGSSCETVEQMPLDDGPPGRALKQRLRVRRGGKVRVKVACPRRALVACRGVLTLRHPRTWRVLARGRYRVGLGKKTRVSVRPRRRLPARVAAETLEQGASQRGPRFSSRLLRVKR